MSVVSKLRRKIHRRIKRDIKSIWRVGVEYPIKGTRRILKGDIKGAVKYVRLAGRQQIGGIRAREVAAVAGLAVGGYAIAGGFAGSTAAGTAAATSGTGVTVGGAGTVAVGSSTAAMVGGAGIYGAGSVGTVATGAAVTGASAVGATSTLGSIIGTVGSVAKTAATVLGLSSLLGLRNPGMGPESLPQENAWGGMMPAMYGRGGGFEATGAPLGFGAGAPTGLDGYEPGIFRGSNVAWIAALAALLIGGFFLLRK